MSEQREAISVGELSLYIKSMLDGDARLRDIAVKGEISNFKLNTSGHVYFTLKDETAAIRCVMFRNAAAKLRFRPDNGLKVIAVGSVSSFPRDGQYQLYCGSLTPDGVGDLYLAYEQLKERLGAEGLFDLSHKKPLPRYPMKIGIVTSPTGAAIRDMLRILGRRWPLAKVLVVPAKVQGEGAAAEIAAGIKFLSDRMLVELVITGRGGGSIEDLWCFNEETVARAIYACRIPIISAVGHEPDVTISDFVADARAATPSNAAEIAVPDSSELTVRLIQQQGKLLSSMNARLRLSRQRLDAAAGRRVLLSPSGYVDERRLALDYVSGRLEKSGQQIVAEGERRFASAAAKLDALSPLKVLGRGYSIALREDKSAARSASELAVGEKLTLKMASGEADCEVISLREQRDTKEGAE